MPHETQRPDPPQTIDGEALAEWHHVVVELETAGTLTRTDRAILIVYVETWAAWRKVARHVAEFGAVVRMGNGVVCQSPQYKAMTTLAAQLRGLLGDLGLTPAARAKSKAPPEEATDDLDI